jgi:hypothetical protein
MLLKLSSTPMDPRLRFFISNIWSWELNITTTNLTAYLHQTGIPHDAMLANTLMHHHNQNIFQHFLHEIQKSYSLVKVFCIYSFTDLRLRRFCSSSILNVSTNL